MITLHKSNAKRVMITIWIANKLLPGSLITFSGTVFVVILPAPSLTVKVISVNPIFERSSSSILDVIDFVKFPVCSS